MIKTTSRLFMLEYVESKLMEYGAERVRIGRKWVRALKRSYIFSKVIEF